MFAAGDMYRLTLAGELLSVVSSEITGLNDEPIDLHVLPGGQLLIAEQQPARIRLCEVDSWNCRPLGVAAVSVIKRQFKVLPGNSSGELLLTDARGDTLWGLDEDDGELQKLLPDGTLAGPNGMTFDDSGRLWVADTDHRKIIELLPSENGSYLPGREHSAVNSLTVGEHFYPMMLERTVDGRLWVAQAAMILFAVLMIPAAIRATPKERRWTPAPAAFDFSNAPEQVPPVKGIHWLERDPKIERSLKWLGYLGFALFILMTAGAFALYAWVRTQAGPNPGEEQLAKLDELGITLLLSGFLGVLVLPAIHYSVRAMKRKLGTDGRLLYIRLADGRELSVEPFHLAYTNRLILYRKYTLPLQGGKQQRLYAPGEVETWIAPLLRQSRKLTEMQALKQQLKNFF